MQNNLILYSTTDGHTVEICRRMQQVIEQHGNQVTLASIADNTIPDLEAFDQIVIGASIRYGRHNPLVSAFIKRHQTILDRKPNAFFSVNVVARKPEKNHPETNPYMRKFLKKISWKPQRLAVFAGKLDYPKLGFFDRAAIRFIMWITKGPTDPTRVVEFTDWERVDEFARSLSV
jgi:menaquinone-dependent protoporphyrinogen oxidase